MSDRAPDSESAPNGATVKATPRRNRPYRKAMVLLLLLVGVVVSLGLWLRPDWFLPTAGDDEGPDPVVTVENPGFVGPKACAECHLERCTEFEHTRHYRACTPASGTKAPGFAPGVGTYSFRDWPLQVEMIRSGSELHATAVESSFGAAQRTTFPIGLVYGADGAGDELYFTWINGNRLYQLPIAWLHSLGKWADVGDPTPRATPPNCVECHNTWAAHTPGTANEYRREDMILGVTCERCHGPGKEHVEFHRRHPNEAAHAIVQPRDLGRERLMDVCNQCHSPVRPIRPVFSYRPGEPLDESYRLTQSRHSEDEPVANQVAFLRQSKCFQKSKMTCITCHHPHRPQPIEEVRRSCLKCHTAEACLDQPRLPVGVREDCVGCHMPSRVWMNVRFHTAQDRYVPAAPRADHRIAVHAESKQAVLLAWLRKQPDAKSRTEADRLASELGKYWLAEAEKRRRDFRGVMTIGALREALKVDPQPATQRKLQEAIDQVATFDRLLWSVTQLAPNQLDEAIHVQKQILEIKPDHAPGHMSLGMMYASQGNRQEAIAHLRAVEKFDPDDASGLAGLARLAYQEERWEESVELLSKATRIDPLNPDMHEDLGKALAKLERWVQAAERFRFALRINPRQAASSAGLSEALLRQGETEEALLHSRRAVRWTESKDASKLLTLADVYLALGRRADARKTLRQALEVAEATHPDLVPAIRRRLGPWW